MTATEAAPAAMTAGAVSSVMPPIATTGRPDCAGATARLGDGLESNRVVAGGLCRRAVGRSNREIGNRLAQGRIDLIDRVGGEADDRVRSGDSADVGRGEIVLADVDVPGPHQPGNVGPIVDHQNRPGAGGVFGDRLGELQERSAWERLRSQLQQPGPAGEKRARQGVRLPTARGAHLDIDNGVERRERDRHDAGSVVRRFRRARSRAAWAGSAP